MVPPPFRGGLPGTLECSREVWYVFLSVYFDGLKRWKMASKKKVPEHFERHLGKIRQWFDGFAAAGGNTAVDRDTLRQIQL